MSRARILLIGNRGQVGWELQRTLSTLGQVVALDRPQIELSNPDSIRAVVRENSPTFIINAAAYTAVDQAEDEPELATQINSVAPAIMAEEAKRSGAVFITYSTDYVYDGTKPGPYIETDKPNPLSVYGCTKLEGDQAVQAIDGAHFIFRTSWVYGARGKNFLLTMIKLGRERKSLKVVNDQIGAPTWSRLIAEATAQVISHCADGTGSPAQQLADLRGAYNLTCGGNTSWHGFTDWILKSLAAKGDVGLAELDPISAAEYPTRARRPANSVLNCDKLEATFGIRLPEWDQAAALVMDELFSLDTSLNRSR